MVNQMLKHKRTLLKILLTTSCVFSIGLSSVPPLFLNQKFYVNSNEQTLGTKTIQNNFINWVDQSLTTNDEDFVKKANTYYQKYITNSSESSYENKPFLNFSSIVFANNQANLEIIKNNTNDSIMGVCRTVIQNLFSVAKAIYLNGDKNLMKMYSDILDDFVTNYFKTGEDIKGNWWNYEIGVPKDLLKGLNYIYTLFPIEQVKKWLSPIQYYKSDAEWKFVKDKPKTIRQKGANLTDGAYSVILYSNMINDGEKIKSTIDFMINDLFGFWREGKANAIKNGTYQDGSYIDHANDKLNNGGLAYFGGYGIDLIKSFLYIRQMVEGTNFDLKNYESIFMFYQMIETTVMPYMYQMSVSDTIVQRGVSRKNYNNKSHGAQILNTLYYFIDDAPDDYKSRLENFIYDQLNWNVPDELLTYNLKQFKKTYKVKHNKKRYVANQWQEQNYFDSYNNNDQNNLTPFGIDLTRENYNFVFSKNQDRYTYQTNDYMFSLALTSGRTYHYESTNYENSFGYYQGDGLTLIENHSKNNHANDYWTVVDPFKLPGTSSIYENDITTLTNEQIETNQKYSENADKDLSSLYGNGINYNGYGIASSRVVNYNKTLQTDRAYVFLNGLILVVGNTKKLSNSSVNTSGKNVYSTILNDQSNEGLVQQELLINNSKVTKYQSLSNSYYVLKNHEKVKTNSLYSRTVNPYAVNINRKSEETITKNFNEVWFDHGTLEANTSDLFAYVIVPSEKNQNETIEKIANLNIINFNNSSNSFNIQYKENGITYSFATTFSNNVKLSQMGVDFTYSLPTSSMIMNDGNNYKMIMSPNVETKNYSVTTSVNLNLINTRNVNGTNEVSIIDKSINVLNDLYWNNDILHNTWIKFTKQ